MKSLRAIVFAVAMSTFFAPFIAWAEEAEPVVMEVIVIDVTGASEPYPAMYDRITEVYKTHGSAGKRSLWFNAFAGPDTGVANVTVEYPNMAALTADGKLVRSSVYQATGQEFQAKGFRVTSRSIAVQQR